MLERRIITLIASMAYSTWKRRPSGENVLTPRSYSLLQFMKRGTYFKTLQSQSELIYYLSVKYIDSKSLLEVIIQIMSKVEKISILASLGSAALFSAYILLRPRLKRGEESQETLLQKRKRVLADDNIRVLYSSMSFLYLQGYEGTARNLFLLRDVLDVAKPKIVAVQLSEEDYKQDYVKVLKHPKFDEIMKKVDFLIKTKDEQALDNLQEIDIKRGFENLYLVNYCLTNQCRVVYADDPLESYDFQIESKRNLIQMAKQQNYKIPDHLQQLFEEANISDLKMTDEQIRNQVLIQKRSEVFVDKLMKELHPKFSLIPDTPYKVIVGMVNKENVEEVVKTWKSQFMSVYGHVILEDKKSEQTQ